MRKKERQELGHRYDDLPAHPIGARALYVISAKQRRSLLVPIIVVSHRNKTLRHTTSTCNLIHHPRHSKLLFSRRRLIASKNLSRERRTARDREATAYQNQPPNFHIFAQLTLTTLPPTLAHATIHQTGAHQDNQEAQVRHASQESRRRLQGRQRRAGQSQHQGQGHKES